MSAAELRESCVRVRRRRGTNRLPAPPVLARPPTLPLHRSSILRLLVIPRVCLFDGSGAADAAAAAPKGVLPASFFFFFFNTESDGPTQRPRENSESDPASR